MRLGGWKTKSGVFLAAILFVGCFVPVVYGVYKVYESADTQTITLLVNDSPDKVYTAAIEAAQKNQVEISKRDDKERTFEGKRKDGIIGSVRVLTGPEQKGSALVIAAKKGKDPEAERKALLESTLATCQAMNIQCTEQQPKK